MASRADTGTLRGQYDGLVVRATQDLDEFWGALDLNRPERARDALLAFMPVLTDTYGDIAATVAADWYEEQRDAAGVRRGSAVVLAATVPAVAVAARTRFGAGHLFTDAPGKMLPFLEGITSEYVLQPGRDTITQTATRDPAAAGWHRETRGGCDFCTMLAARGAVYKQATAHFSAHPHCSCIAAPSWDADAPEVPVGAYEASKSMQFERDKAAAGDVKAQERLDAHRARVRDYLASQQ